MVRWIDSYGTFSLRWHDAIAHHGHLGSPPARRDEKLPEPYTMKLRQRSLTILSGLLAATLLAGCGESREDKMKRELSYLKQDEKERPTNKAEAIAPHPVRESLTPLLTKLYSGQRLPDVMELDYETGGNGYELTAGVLSVVKLSSGLSTAEKAKAIIRAVAEADAWVPRSNARKTYAQHIHKVKRSFSDEQKDLVLATYADLKLLNFFNSPDAEAAISALPGDVQGSASDMRREFQTNHQAVWDKWMSVKMFARREVSNDEPFKPVLRGIRAKLGMEEPEPRSWEDSHDAPFQKWAAAAKADRELFEMLSNLKEYRDQLDFQSDTHTIWAKEGSPMIPEKARDVEIDKRLGFGVHREDLGGGYQDMTFVFSKRLAGKKLKAAYIRSHIYRHIFSDFQLLATAGTDFEGGTVPDSYDPAYAYCGSEAAYDSMVASFNNKHALLADLRAKVKTSEKILERAHKCIVKLGQPDIKSPDKDDPMAMEGPAPASRLALFQMLARFENPVVDLSAMRKAPDKGQDELDAEAFLKANPNKQQ